MTKGRAYEVGLVRPGLTFYRVEPCLRLSQPHFAVETFVSHVVVSTARTERGSCETYIFAADGYDNILSWNELYGCSADIGPAAALAALGEGYEIVPLEAEGECDDCGDGPIAYSESGCDYCVDCSTRHATGGW